MTEEGTHDRFKDGKSGLSEDRILVRWVNRTQIMLAFLSLGGALIGAWWFSVQIVRFVDKTNQIGEQLSIVQQQQSRFEQLLVGHRVKGRGRRSNDDDEDQ